MVSKVLRLLEAKAYVERAAHGHDARAKEVRLTGRGLAASDAAIAITATAQAEYFAPLGSERAAFEGMLDRLLGPQGR